MRLRILRRELSGERRPVSARAEQLAQRINGCLGYRGANPEFDTETRQHTGRLVLSVRAVDDLLDKGGDA